MAIKFNCPQCEQAFSVSEDRAGKRAQCFACKHIFVIPAPSARPADVDEFAAAALAEREGEEKSAETLAQIEFECPYCDTKVKVDSELAGKQTPCPKCRRIIKVPVPEKSQQKDWRSAGSRRPLGARRDLEAAPQGAWGARDIGSVSVESLIQAEAIPSAQQHLSRRQRLAWGAIAALVLGVGGAGVWIFTSWTIVHTERRAIERTRELLEAKQDFVPNATAALYRMLGEYYLRDEKSEQARNDFQHSRAEAAQKGDPLTADFILRDLALAQIDLAGEKSDVTNGTRISWDDTFKELRQTVQKLQTLPGRIHALRALTQKLIDKGQARAAGPLAALFANETPELLAVVSLELFRAHQDEEAMKVAEQALGRPQLPGVNPQIAPASQSVYPTVVALQLILGKADAETVLAEFRKDQKDANPALLLGVVRAWAWQGKLDQAHAAVESALTPAIKLNAIAALIEAAAENGHGEAASRYYDGAATLAEFEKDRPESAAIVYNLVGVGREIGQASRAYKLMSCIANPELRAWAELEFLTEDLATHDRPQGAAQADPIDKVTVARGLAIEVIFRHNVRAGGGTKRTLGECEALAPPWVRPFAYVGTARGLQDRKK
jgi:hypothetical protein